MSVRISQGNLHTRKPSCNHPQHLMFAEMSALELLHRSKMEFHKSC